jgi:hypothetical protein
MGHIPDMVLGYYVNRVMVIGPAVACQLIRIDISWCTVYVYLTVITTQIYENRNNQA